MKGHLLITGEKWTKFIIIIHYLQSVSKVQEPCKNARSDCSILDSVLPHLVSPPQQLERKKSLWSLLKRKALETQDVQVVCHLHNMQSTPQQWCPHQVTKAPQMQVVAKCNHHTIFPKGKKEQPEE